MLSLVVYLSGSVGKSLQWHREYDTVASSVEVPKEIEAELVSLMEDTGNLEPGEIEQTSGRGARPVALSPDGISDICSDHCEDDGAMGEFCLKVINDILECEAIDGTVYLVRGKP